MTYSVRRIISSIVHRPQSLQPASRSIRSIRALANWSPTPFSGIEAFILRIIPPTPPRRHRFRPNASGCNSIHTAKRSPAPSAISINMSPAPGELTIGALSISNHCGGREKVTHLCTKSVSSVRFLNGTLGKPSLKSVGDFMNSDHWLVAA
jgi:hypothetical protein